MRQGLKAGNSTAGKRRGKKDTAGLWLNNGALVRTVTGADTAPGRHGRCGERIIPFKRMRHQPWIGVKLALCACSISACSYQYRSTYPAWVRGARGGGAKGLSGEPVWRGYAAAGQGALAPVASAQSPDSSAQNQLPEMCLIRGGAWTTRPSTQAQLKISRLYPILDQAVSACCVSQPTSSQALPLSEETDERIAYPRDALFFAAPHS